MLITWILGCKNANKRFDGPSVPKPRQRMNCDRIVHVAFFDQLQKTLRGSFISDSSEGMNSSRVDSVVLDRCDECINGFVCSESPEGFSGFATHIGIGVALQRIEQSIDRLLSTNAGEVLGGFDASKEFLGCEVRLQRR